MLDQQTLDLDAGELLAAARTEAALDDFGDETFMEGLTRLLAAVTAEAGLTPMGIMGLKADVVRLLVNRLRIHAAVTAHPEILEEDVSDPIVITGLPRTGTTKLQKSLAINSGFQKLLLWQILNPAPFGELGQDPDPRITTAEQRSALMSTMSPEFMAGHPMTAEEPEEDLLLMQLTFRTPSFGYLHRAPSYVDWVLGVDPAPTYEDLRRSLQYLQWQDGGRRDRPWILKTPIHLGALETLLRTFPAATVVHCHRDPCVAVPSTCRLAELARLPNVEDLDRVELGSFLSSFWADAWARNIDQRSQLPEAQILDVGYEQIRDDIASVLREIYARRDQPLDTAALEEMVAWEKENPQHKFGKFDYSLERFGLTRESVEKDFATYLEWFSSRPNV